MSVRTRAHHIDGKKQKTVTWRQSFKKQIAKHSEGGLALRGCRYKADISQKKLADEIGISQHHISEMETGKRQIGKVMAHRFAKFFDVDYRIFL